MAFTSLIGLAFKGAFTGIQPGVLENWLAAAPLVALGVPLGAFAVALIGRKPALIFLAVLCVTQFVSTCYAERVALGVVGILLAVCAVALALVGLYDCEPGAGCWATCPPNLPPLSSRYSTNLRL
jgi:hypothetical protein